jgi:hypothetical protein
MIAERAYSALLLLFPKSFRDEFRRDMLADFHEMHRALETTNAPPLRFWTFIVADTLRAAARERLDGARWLATALFGLLVTTGVAHGVTFTYRYLYHPYFEGMTIPALPYGLALGLVLGCSIALAQLLLFPAAEERAGRWMLASAVALPIAILFCGTAIEHALDGVSPLAAQPHLLALDVFVVGLAHQKTWMDLATQFSAMAASALAVRAIARPDVRGCIWDRGRHAD